MRKLLLTSLLFVSLFGTAMAPPSSTLIIPMAYPIVHFDGGSFEPLMDAIYHFETHSDSLAINLTEKAYGGFQIRPNRLKHYNDLNSTNYTLEDCLNLEVSRKIFLYFTNHNNSGKPIKPKSWEQAAKNWNGGGPKTITYWDAVKKLI
jgi:hypothetical protein